MRKEKFYINTKDFSFQNIDGDSEDNEFLIKGFAINPGDDFHGFLKIEESEMENIKNTLKNKVILINHMNETNSAVGKVTFSELRINPLTNKVGVYFEGFVDIEEKSLIRKISKGILNAVSIGFSYEKAICAICGEEIQNCEHWFDDDGFKVILRGIEVNELSIVPVPADKNATVSEKTLALFSKELIEFKEKKNMADKNEAKFSELSEKFANTVEKHNNEINELKESHKEEMQKLKDNYDAKFAEKLGEVKTLETELEKTKAEFSEITEKCEKLESELKLIEDAKLEAFRDEVFKLSEQVNGGLTKEEIGEFSETVLNKYSEVFKNIIKSQPNIIKPTNFKNKEQHPYSKDENFENASVADRLLSKINR